MSLTQQHGTTKALIVATIGTIAALGAAYAVRVSTKKKTALPSKEQEQEQHQQEQHQQEHQQQQQQQPVEFYERAPFVYYGGNASDPETYDYDSNPTVYGKILRGELKTRFLLETERFVLFEDIMPRAPLHALIDVVWNAHSGPQTFERNVARGLQEWRLQVVFSHSTIEQRGSFALARSGTGLANVDGQ